MNISDTDSDDDSVPIASLVPRNVTRPRRRIPQIDSEDEDIETNEQTLNNSIEIGESQSASRTHTIIATPAGSTFPSPSSSVGSSRPAGSGSLFLSTPTGVKERIPVQRNSDNLKDLSVRDIVTRMYDRQSEILTRLKSLEVEVKQSKPVKVDAKIAVPPGVKNAVHSGYQDGGKKGLKWFFDGKRVNDDVNKEMCNHISNFVTGWNPSYDDPTVLNAAMSRYFITKRQEEQAKKKDRHEEEKKRRAKYERKKEKSKRRKLSLEAMGLSVEKTTKIQRVLDKITLMSSDEECHDGFITHQPSWQSDKFVNYKGILDSKFEDICSKKSKRLMQKRTIGEPNVKEVPQLEDHDMWIVKQVEN